MQENETALDCHVVTADGASGERIKVAVKERLAEEFGIQHSTLELEDRKNAHEGAKLYGHDKAGT
jgi:cobalt-zinc-cadmium efflux system protein